MENADYSKDDAVTNSGITWEGCSVLLDINDGDRLVFARLSAASTVKVGKKKFSLKTMISCPFGSIFHVENGTDGPYLARSQLATPGTDESGDSVVGKETKDNRTIVDDNNAQNLSGKDIDEMKRHGLRGDEIVEALVANSTTFEKKTSFSQDKYRLKKKKKYAPKVVLRKPVARSVCEAYFKKYPDRTGRLRVDTLSLLLSLANVSFGMDVLVVDMVGGLLTGAVAERLCGSGYVCNTYFGVTPHSIDIASIFNFSHRICERIVICPLTDLIMSKDDSLIPGSQQDMQECCNLSGSSAISPEPGSFPSTNPMVDVIYKTESIGKIKKSTKIGERAPREAILSWKENGFSSLIIAAPDADAWGIVSELLPLLAYSSPFVIYHRYLQPLATCMHKLQVGMMAIGMQITEPWMREYQVLPSRTHPVMQMSATGGYILSGTRISFCLERSL